MKNLAWAILLAFIVTVGWTQSTNGTPATFGACPNNGTSLCVSTYTQGANGVFGFGGLRQVLVPILTNTTPTTITGGVTPGTSTLVGKYVASITINGVTQWFTVGIGNPDSTVAMVQPPPAPFVVAADTNGPYIPFQKPDGTLINAKLLVGSDMKATAANSGHLNGVVREMQLGYDSQGAWRVFGFALPTPVAASQPASGSFMKFDDGTSVKTVWP